MPFCLLPVVSLEWANYVSSPGDAYHFAILILITLSGLAISYATINLIKSAFVNEDGISIDGELIAWKDILRIRMSLFPVYKVITKDNSFYVAPSGLVVGFYSLVLWGDEMYSIFAKRGFMERSAFNY